MSRRTMSKQASSPSTRRFMINTISIPIKYTDIDINIDGTLLDSFLKYKIIYQQKMEDLLKEYADKFNLSEHHFIESFVLPPSNSYSDFTFPKDTVACSFILPANNSINFNVAEYKDKRQLYDNDLFEIRNDVYDFSAKKYGFSTPENSVSVFTYRCLYKSTKIYEDALIYTSNSYEFLQQERDFYMQPGITYGYTANDCIIVNVIKTNKNDGFMPYDIYDAIDSFFNYSKSLAIRVADFQIRKDATDFVKENSQPGMERFITMKILEDMKIKNTAGEVRSLTIVKKEFKMQPFSFNEFPVTEYEFRVTVRGDSLSGAQGGTSQMKTNIKFTDEKPVDNETYRAKDIVVKQFAYADELQARDFVLDVFSNKVNNNFVITWELRAPIYVRQGFGLTARLEANSNVGLKTNKLSLKLDKTDYTTYNKVISNDEGYTINYSAERTYTQVENIKYQVKIPYSEANGATREVPGFQIYTSNGFPSSTWNVSVTAINNEFNLDFPQSSLNINNNMELTYLSNPLGLDKQISELDASFIYFAAYQKMLNQSFSQDIENIKNRLDAFERATRPSALGIVTDSLQMIANFNPPVAIAVKLAKTLTVLDALDSLLHGDAMSAVISGSLAFTSNIYNARNAKINVVEALNRDVIKQQSQYIDNKFDLLLKYKEKKFENGKKPLADSIKIVSSNIKQLPGSSKVVEFLNARPNNFLTKFLQDRNNIPEHRKVKIDTIFDVKDLGVVKFSTNLGISDGVNSQRGDLNFLGSSPATGKLPSQPGVSMVPLVLKDGKFEIYEIQDRKKQFQAHLAMLGAKRSELLTLSVEELEAKYKTTFNETKKKLLDMHENNEERTFKEEFTTIFPTEHPQLISHFTSEDFKKNFQYDLVKKNCQGYADKVMDNLLGSFDPSSYLPSPYFRKVDKQLNISNINELEESLNNIYNSLISFAPGFLC